MVAKTCGICMQKTYREGPKVGSRNIVYLIIATWNLFLNDTVVPPIFRLIGSKKKPGIRKFQN